MELKKALILIIMVMAVAILAGKSSANTFRDCYTKCFIFCMIEPSQTLCSCTTHCLKDCIFEQIQNDVPNNDVDSDSLGFCKLGCALSTCSNFSTKRTPNGEKVGSCVGSCSNRCIKSYSSMP